MRSPFFGRVCCAIRDTFWSHFRDQNEEWKALHNMLIAQLTENADDRGREPVDGGVDIFEILETFLEAVEAVSVKSRPSKAESA